MTWFKQKQGLDLNFAKKQSWWGDVSHIVLTDEKTQKDLVDYIFVKVSEAKLQELKFIDECFSSGVNIDDVLAGVESRRKILIHYLAQAGEKKT